MTKVEPENTDMGFKDKAKCTFPLCILPTVCTVWIQMSVFITFGISVGNNHTDVNDIPYISHAATSTGTPQTYIFAQLINISAVLLIVVGTMRYLYVKKELKQMKIEGCCNRDRCLHVNRVVLIIGIISDIGFSMTACFPSDTARAGHYIGGVLLFPCAVFYCILQSYLSYKIYVNTTLTTKCELFTLITQILIAVLATCFCVIFIVGMALNILIKEEMAYKASSIGEWFTAILMSMFMLTYTCDFRKVKFKPSLIDKD